LNTGAHLLEHARLFIDLDIDAAFKEGERSSEPANAAADDADLGM
jgi:hypothetical protein